MARCRVVVCVESSFHAVASPRATDLRITSPKAEARALRRAFNISNVAAEEIGNAPVAGNADGPIEDVQIQGIRKVGKRKGLDTDSLILNTIKSNAGGLNELTAQEGREAMKVLNRIKKK